MRFTAGKDKAPQIGPTAAAELIRGGAYLLDVREPDEWQAGHSPDAHHVPLGQLQASDVPADREIIAVCRSGGRSAKATTALRQSGLRVSNLDGGMTAWAAAGLPVVDDAGSAGHIA